MTPQQPTPGSTQATVAAFEVAGRHYEARLNDCGKINCRKCGGAGRRHPSHGPYWYLCVMSRGSWRRIYLGKDLDTTKYVDPTGHIDWAAVRNKRARKNTTEATNHDVPGQTNIYDMVPDPLADRAAQEATP